MMKCKNCKHEVIIIMDEVFHILDTDGSVHGERNCRFCDCDNPQLEEE